MAEALIGFLGVLLGLLMSEYFRRRGRIEGYAREIFSKRLRVYEELYSKMSMARLIAFDVIDSTDLIDEERKDTWGEVFLDFSGFIDTNELYINREIAFHCLLTLVGADDIYYIDNIEEKDDEKKAFFENIAKTIDMIRDETGLEKIDKHFGTLTMAKHRSELIEFYREAKKKYKQ